MVLIISGWGQIFVILKSAFQFLICFSGLFSVFIVCSETKIIFQTLVDEWNTKIYSLHNKKKSNAFVFIISIDRSSSSCSSSKIAKENVILLTSVWPTHSKLRSKQSC